MGDGITVRIGGNLSDKTVAVPDLEQTRLALEVRLGPVAGSLRCKRLASWPLTEAIRRL
jgi:hypothetical protein